MKANLKTKILLLLLAFAMIGTMLSACKGRDELSENTVDSSKDPKETPEEDSTSEIVPDFEPTNYNAEICILQNDYSNGSILREEWD